MDSVEANVARLLEGKALEGEVLCDFTLSEQNEAIGNGIIIIIINNVWYSCLKAVGDAIHIPGRSDHLTLYLPPIFLTWKRFYNYQLH